MSNAKNINDAAGVAALLDQLRASPQWQEVAAGMAGQPQPPEEQINHEPAPSATAHPNHDSVASLLSQLEFPAINHPATGNSASVLAGRVNQMRPVEEDRRQISFRAALPILSELAEHGPFLSGVKKIREEQNSLERELWAEREAIYSKYHEKFKIAQTKAQMIGTTVSQSEVDMMTNVFKKELDNFDNGRAIPAWDGLVSRQQQELERLRVPAMFHANAVQDRERQQEVIQVLETMGGFRACLERSS